MASKDFCDYLERFNKLDKNTVLDQERGREKANRIISVIKKFTSIPLNKKICIDIGCSSGIIANNISKHFKKTIGIDIDKKAITSSKFKGNTCSLFIGSGSHIPLKNEFADIVLCNHVYQYLSKREQKFLFDEIFRILKNDGLCYLATGNKYSFIENNYQLFFLTWLPKKLASKYVRITKRGNSFDENYLSYFGLKKLLVNFLIYDYTMDVLTSGFLKNPYVDYVISKIPKPILKIFYPFFTSYIFILTKKI